MAKPTDGSKFSVTTQQSPVLAHGESPILARAELLIVHTPDQVQIGKSIPLDRHWITIGRDAGEHAVRIEDLQLSRTHFRVAYDGRAGTHRIGDLRSRNGTYVNGMRIESLLLGSGSVVRAGESVFVYRTYDAFAQVVERAHRVAASPLGVLLLGETGTGKERLARTIHEKSNRRGSFVPVNCAALPRELLGAELFGHTKGAFSGASGSRRGLFQSASGGTLFLDEVGDLPLELQGVLLRALQEGSVRPLGSDEEVAVDVRIVAATHRQLDEGVDAKRFRADLYARLAQAVIVIPPLRDRAADILPLAREFAACSNGPRFAMTADAAEALVRYRYPFNVRELQSLVRAYLATEDEQTLGTPYLARYAGKIMVGFRVPNEAGAKDADVGAFLEASRGANSTRDRSAMEGLLARHRGNVSAAASELGTSRTQLYRWLRAIGLTPARFR
jgi:transcriptional regulator with GAF, ATPase, and Fis domain